MCLVEVELVGRNLGIWRARGSWGLRTKKMRDDSEGKSNVFRDKKLNPKLDSTFVALELGNIQKIKTYQFRLAANYINHCHLPPKTCR